MQHGLYIYHKIYLTYLLNLLLVLFYVVSFLIFYFPFLTFLLNFLLHVFYLENFSLSYLIFFYFLYPFFYTSSKISCVYYIANLKKWQVLNGKKGWPVGQFFSMPLFQKKIEVNYVDLFMVARSGIGKPRPKNSPLDCFCLLFVSARPFRFHF